ncbi:MAG TPA: nucleotide pyrophosphatase/phosphodiesterase family protein [Intrasporangium sp.]|uniref:alkaline phosphatase family protein n=1 Tax=Intrasporangium sp. TaxID=1925024 RepID=UPI002D78E5D4|nr:alkaline phosphatase family protein [Intrasporangium sp.]HET7399349.1 nucleotide pyrophosphatase/phosphodiesterase family protein [Intrasporangium sp.]
MTDTSPPAAAAAAAAAAPTAPDWSAGSLSSLLPAVAARLGVPRYAGSDLFDLPPARRTVVVLVDGLGFDLLGRRSGHAPFLRGLLPVARRIPCGFPSTTATSMGSFGTGLPPGAHGLVGFSVLDPDTDRLLNELSWEDGPDPFRWQPNDTVFQHADAAGVSVTRIGPGFFDGSGLTNAALRGGRFTAAERLDDRVEASLAAVRAARRSLVYLYWGDIDKIGHVHGCESWQWGDELESVDRALSTLVAGVPDDTSVVITADHGMVDVPFTERVDLAHEPGLMDGVRHLGGESRSLALYLEPGAQEAVASAWRERLGERATILTREQAVDEGWFGPVRARVLPRIGDLLVNMRGTFAVVHSGLMRPEVVRLLGLHGSSSEAELAVPVIAVPPRRGS